MRRLPVKAFYGTVMMCLLWNLGADAQAPSMSSELSIPNEAEVVDASKPRDPFWPVGYVPKIVQPPKVKAGTTSIAGEPDLEPVKGPLWDEARKKVDIRGISLIRDKESNLPKYLAMISGKIFETGDVVMVKYIDHVYRWKIASINDDGVALQKLDVRSE